jgi:hypothetical protein
VEIKDVLAGIRAEKTDNSCFFGQLLLLIFLNNLNFFFNLFHIELVHDSPKVLQNLVNALLLQHLEDVRLVKYFL